MAPFCSMSEDYEENYDKHNHNFASCSYTCFADIVIENFD